MKTNLICITLLFFSCFVFTSCKKSESNLESILEKNILKSSEKYAELLIKRNGGGTEFNIKNIERKEEILTITVNGGCYQEDFMIVWDGSILLTYPAQINLVLYNKSKEGCGLEHQFDIKVNLKKIVEKYDPNDFIFNIANGSKQQDKSLNPNGSITDK